MRYAWKCLFCVKFGAISLIFELMGGECSGWHSVRRHTHEARYRCDSFTSCSGSFDTATTLKIPLELPF